jgi:hypothetical protein
LRGQLDRSDYFAVHLDNDRLANRAVGHTAQRIFTTILKNQRDSLSEIRPSLGTRATLPVRSGDFWTVGHKPLAVLFDYRREFVVHDDAILPDVPVVSSLRRGDAQGRPPSPRLRRLDDRLGLRRSDFRVVCNAGNRNEQQRNDDDNSGATSDR